MKAYEVLSPNTDRSGFQTGYLVSQLWMAEQLAAKRGRGWTYKLTDVEDPGALEVLGSKVELDWCVNGMGLIDPGPVSITWKARGLFAAFWGWLTSS